MGKKNRNRSKQSEEESSDSNRTKRKHIDTVHYEEKSNLNTKESCLSQKIKKTKKNRDVPQDDEGSSTPDNSKTLDATTSNSENNSIEVKTKQLKKKNKGNQNTPNKKIIFDDNDDEVSKETNSNNLKFLQGEEAEVKDEDIDKFCEEVTEEDNAQYENWVKLVEAQLSSAKNSNNKKKKSNKT